LENIKSRVDEKKIQIMEEDAGLHFLLKVDTGLKDEEIVDRAAQNGINISCLSQYYYDKTHAIENTLVINYSGVNAKNIQEGVDRLFDSF
jgi:GntR family transcriptional regulator/MocR family aminotransferase